MRKTFIDSDH